MVHKVHVLRLQTLVLLNNMHLTLQTVNVTKRSITVDTLFIYIHEIQWHYIGLGL